MDNRIHVLNLLDEGKINVDEAVKLLKALGGNYHFKVEECCKEEASAEEVDSQESSDESDHVPVEESIEEVIEDEREDKSQEEL